jgi:hypothetical protein
MLFNPVCGYRHLEELIAFIFMVDVSSDGMWWVKYEDGAAVSFKTLATTYKTYRVSHPRRPQTKIATNPYV